MSILLHYVKITDAKEVIWPVIPQFYGNSLKYYLLQIGCISQKKKSHKYFFFVISWHTISTWLPIRKLKTTFSEKKWRLWAKASSRKSLKTIFFAHIWTVSKIFPSYITARSALYAQQRIAFEHNFSQNK